MSTKPKALTREDWIEAARKVFVVSGIDGVKVDRLARQMRVTRGSFYWHFKNRQSLLDALLEQWEGQNRRELEHVRDRWQKEGPDLVEVVRIWLKEDPAYPTFDMAIRLWARKSPVVAKIVRRTDDEWITLFKSMLSLNADDELENLARARVIYFHQIGYYALAIEESFEQRLTLAPYYHKVLLGRDGGASLDRLIHEFRADSA